VSEHVFRLPSGTLTVQRLESQIFFKSFEASTPNDLNKSHIPHGKCL